MRIIPAQSITLSGSTDALIQVFVVIETTEDENSVNGDLVKVPVYLSYPASREVETVSSEITLQLTEPSINAVLEVLIADLKGIELGSMLLHCLLIDNN